MHEPLTPHTYNFLLALAQGNAHAYTLQQRALSIGQIFHQASRATVKRILERALKKKYVSTYQHADGRLMYHLEEPGLRAIENEITRLHQAANRGQAMLISGGYRKF